MKLTQNYNGKHVLRLHTVTKAHKEQFASEFTATLFFGMYVVGYMDREFRLLTEAACQAGVYSRENKRDINAISASVNDLMRIQRFAHNETLRQTMDKTLRYWKAQYDRDNSSDIMNRLQAMAFKNCKAEWTKFNANLANMLNVRIKREDRRAVACRILAINALANIMLTSITSMTARFRTLYPSFTLPMQDSRHHIDSIVQRSKSLADRIAPETAEEVAANIWSDACQKSLSSFSYSLIDNTKDCLMQQFYNSEKDYLSWYIGRIVMEYRDCGKIPSAVVEEIRKAVKRHYLLLLKELKAWSMVASEEDDPYDIADRMQELSGTLYTRYSEELIRILLDGEDSGGNINGVGQHNLDKLNGQKERGVINGEGDER